ncbi:MAG: FmdB family zinc ribbon protein [Terriglobales bacterium]
MPLYEYECTRCQHRFEKIQRFSDPPIDDCPACGGPVSQLLSPPAIQFKGSGWYVTDYSKKSGSAPSPSNGKSNGSSAGESKPAEAKPAPSSSSSETK